MSMQCKIKFQEFSFYFNVLSVNFVYSTELFSKYEDENGKLYGRYEQQC